MDFHLILDTAPLYLQAAWLTFRIGLIGIGFSLLIGLVCAAFRYFRLPVFSQLAGCYIELSRNTPLLVQLFFLYFGLPRIGIVWSAQACAIIGLSFLGGSYMAEALRSGLESIAKIQWESALSLGIKPFAVFRKVILPQAKAIAMPPISANVIFLWKETSVVSVIALPDLVYTAKEQIGNDYTTNEALFSLVIGYLLILLPVSLLLRYLEERMRNHVRVGN